MKAMDQVTVTFTSRSANEGFARACAACFAAQLDPTLEEVNDIKTAVSEAVTNAIVHAYPDILGRIQVRCRILEGDVLDKTADNTCFVSLSGQRDYLEARGLSTADMAEGDILRANTGSEVFLEAKLTFCDAMEDLRLRIAM